MTPDQGAIKSHVEQMRAMVDTQMATHTFVGDIDKDRLRDAQALLTEGFRIWLTAVDSSPQLRAVK